MLFILQAFFFFTRGSALGDTVTANFSAITDIPVSASSYTATGKDVNLTLGFAPPIGTELKLVDNTGLAFIDGEFVNLTHGQVIELPHNGIIYKFIANYRGGSGNDLVLEWFRRGYVSWGSNSLGQFGNGTSTSSKLPLGVNNMGMLAGKTILSVAAGTSYNLALCSDGKVLAWGANNVGQLGDGSNTNRLLPVAVATTTFLAGRSVIAVAAGYRHSLVLCSDGTLAAWGENTYGQLGNGTTDGQSTPVAVDRTGVLSGKVVVAISAGQYYSMALCSDGTVAAWGYNLSGQLGDNSLTNKSVPVLVDRSGILAGKIVTRISAGFFHNLVQCSDGTLAAWGRNSSGELGDASTTDKKMPVAVLGTGFLSGKTVIALKTGNSHNLVVCSDGSLASWGLNSSGQLGKATTVNSSVPGAVNQSGVLAGKTISRISCGSNASYALCSDGTLTSWGNNSSGRLGDGTTTNRTSPVAVDSSGIFSNQRVFGLAAGNDHCIALTAVSPRSDLIGLAVNGGVLSQPFSSNITAYGTSFSKATPAISLTPTTREVSASVTVNGMAVTSGSPSAAIPVIAGGTIPVVVTAEDLSKTTYLVTMPDDVHAVYSSATDVPVISTGYNATGWLVDFSLGFAPATGTSLTVVRNSGANFIVGKFVNLAQGQSVYLSFNDKVYHFIANYYGGSGNDLVLEWPRRSIAGWGFNSGGQLGVDSSGSNVTTPVAMADQGVLAGKTVTGVASGYAHSLALCADGTMAAWGTGTGGRLGAGAVITQSTRPVAVINTGALAGKSVAAISAANLNNLAVCTDGTLVSWGYGYYGQLGNGTNVSAFEPVQVTQTGVLAGKSVVAVAVGGIHCLAVCSDGSVASWGDNAKGELGDGTTINRMVPVLVSTAGALAGKSVVAVGAGLEYCLALCSDGTLVAWGDNSSRQLGQPSTSSQPSISSVPLKVDQTGVLSGKTVVAISQAAHSTPIVLCSDGTMVSWGLDDRGQRGHSGVEMWYEYNVPGPVTTSGALSGKFVVAVSSGGSSTTAVCSDGAVVAWGDNYSGQLGNNTMTSSNTPVAVTSSTVFAGKKALFGTVAGHCLVVLAEPATDYSSWVMGYPNLSSTSASADPDFDGISNLAEYVLHGNPAISTTAILPVVSANGADMVFNFTRFAISANNTTQVFEYSTDMIHWNSANLTGTTDPRVTLGMIDSNGDQAVTVNIPKAGNKTMFGRLKVFQP